MICNKCGKILPADSGFCQYCGNKIEQVDVNTVVEDPSHKDIIDENFSQKKSVQINRKAKKKINPAIIITAIVFALVVIVGAIAITFSVYYDGLYDDLSEAMLNVDYYHYDSNSIEIDSLINKLPSNYKDVNEIKEQYNQIEKNVKVIESAKLCSEKDSEKIREAYAVLYEFNNLHHNWDLSEYLDKALERSFSKLVFGKEWKDSKYYFQWYEDGDGDGETLMTNLPNNKDYNKDYYFYGTFDVDSGKINYRQFGYENINNSTDKFLAYRIVDVSYIGGRWQIKIYCYSNSRTYTLQ